MPQYWFFLINHLGEPFEASERSFDDDEQACAHAEALTARGYPVEVKSGGVRIKLAPLMTWKAEDWLDRAARHSIYAPQRSVHPRVLRPLTCLRCRGPLAPQDAMLCEACLPN